MLINSLRTMDRVNQSFHVHSLTGLTHFAAFESNVKKVGASCYTLHWKGI